MTIHIEALTFRCIIGLLEHERHTPQEVIVDLELEYDYQGTFINYAEVATEVETHLQEKKYELLEDALENLFNLISQKFPLTQKLSIKISKPEILPNCRVCVSNIKIY